jgi:hypothetical protein
MRLVRAILTTVLITSCVSEGSPIVPLASGTYQFEHRDAEFSTQPGFPVLVTLDGARYVVSAGKRGNGAMCDLYEGTLMWNYNVNQWVLATQESDRMAPEAGRCQDNGPDTIDFKTRIIWTCVAEVIVEESCPDPAADR